MQNERLVPQLILLAMHLVVQKNSLEFLGTLNCQAFHKQILLNYIYSCLYNSLIQIFDINVISGLKSLLRIWGVL